MSKLLTNRASHLANLHTSRRSVLRGLGASTVFFGGLFRSLRAEAAGNNTRAVFFFHANGSHYAWTPMGNGEAFTLTPHLAPLEPVRKDVVILRGLTLARGAGNAHKAATQSALGAGSPTSIDQTLANAVKGTAAFASLEFAIGFTKGGGGMVPSLSQVNGSFIPAERNPVAAYQRIAARITPAPMMADPGGAEKALVTRKSVLDFLRADADRFRGRLGGEEKPKMDLYLESLREVERGLGSFVGGVQAAAGCGKVTPPGEMPNYDLKVADMPKASRPVLDLMAAALACGVTRVMTMMWGGGENQEDIDFTGIRDWHITTHGNPNGPAGEKVMKMQAYLAGEYAYFVQKLKSYGDGPGSPFDHTISIWGTQNGNTNQTNFSKEDHDRRNTPFVLTGRAGQNLKLGRVLDCNEANHPDLYVSVLRAFGQEVSTFGDPAWCKGPLPGLFA
jgi:Protein of unknown function (DUF1552)